MTGKSTLPVSTALFVVAVLGVLSANGKLIFNESFDRKDGSKTEDAIGNGWTTNSGWRANGEKQAFLENGSLRISRLKHANHAVSVKHDFALSDCTVSIKFKLDDEDRLGVNFNDPNLKTSHAGHVCTIRVTTKELSVADQMKGSMNLVLREKRKAGDTSPELKQAIAKTEKASLLNLDNDSWHTLVFELKNDTVTVFIDGVLHLKHQSPGFGHPTKRNIALSVPRNSSVDDFKVWDQAGKK